MGGDPRLANESKHPFSADGTAMPLTFAAKLPIWRTDPARSSMAL